jgi:hypothetical protein
MDEVDEFFVFEKSYYESKFDAIDWNKDEMSLKIRSMQSNFLSMAERQIEQHCQSLINVNRKDKYFTDNQENILRKLLNELAFVNAVANELSLKCGQS